MAGVSCGLRWEVEVQGHFAAGCGGIVSEFEELASKRSDCSCCFKGHFMDSMEEKAFDEMKRRNWIRCCSIRLPFVMTLRAPTPPLNQNCPAKDTLVRHSSSMSEILREICNFPVGRSSAG